MDRSRVALIIPALSEGATIGDVVASALAFGQPIVVDDGSTDDTARIAKSAGAVVVRHERNLGYDRALSSGFAEANRLGFEFAITVDADGQHVPEAIGRFLTEIESGADVVVGVRDRRQRLGEWLFAVVGRQRWGIRDPLCGMKAYRMSIYRRHGHFDTYQSIGTELAIAAASAGRHISELPVATRPREGQPRFGRAISANVRILRALIGGLRRFPARATCTAVELGG